MRRRYQGILLVLGYVTVAAAEPFVVGFERFHAAQPTASGGRLLYNELGCANCHGGETGLPVRRAADLTTVTARQKSEWIRDYLADPAGQHPGTSMPRVFTGRDATDIEAALHYLGTLPPLNTALPKPIRHINAERGKDLFHTKGCVACHAPRDDYDPPDGRPARADLERGTIAFPSLEKKYVLASLAEFVRDPLKTRRDGRMPRIEMDEQDALDIASYLLRIAGSDGEVAPRLTAFVPDRAKVERGRGVVTALRCAACHDLPAVEREEQVLIRETAGGCLAERPAAGVPRYGLGVAQRRALQVFLASRDEPLHVAQRVKLTLEALNCVACHERDGLGGPDPARKVYFQGDHNLGDTGRYPPPLTGIGRKLQPKWLEQALKGPTRVRPYLQTQMPLYGSAVTMLAELFGQADAGVERALPAGEEEAGRKLLGTHGGVSCIACHPWGERASLGIHALDISTLATRLQPGWLREYLIDPAGYRPGTLMPSFWPEGKAANQEILGGDTDRQIASMIAFARSGQGLPEGFPALATREFELTPTQRPIVLRTFMHDVGTHAIIVGFPVGVHVAYDGKESRPALAWKGRFFDGYGTWFSRFAPFEKPLGEAIVKWSAPSGGLAERRFEGYRLDEAGVPIFLFSVEGTRVEERFEAIENGLRRTIRWNAEVLRSVAHSHPAGVTVIEAPDSQPGKFTFVYTW